MATTHRIGIRLIALRFFSSLLMRNKNTLFSQNKDLASEIVKLFTIKVYTLFILLMLTISFQYSNI